MLQEDLKNVNRNTSVAYFAMSKLRDKPKHFLKFYQIYLILPGDIRLNSGSHYMQFNDDKI